jgi:arylsulfatase A-like enzyme
MSSRTLAGFAVAAAILGFIPAHLFAADAATASRQPNIILIVTDDQGYGDFSCHGNPILKTPNLDRLHDEGVRFTDFHVSPTCSPTRASLMTGRHEFRSGVTHTIFERERLSLGATTFPQVLKTAGYTTGIFGKWHLGDEAEYQPNRRGFDEVFIHGGGGIGQTYVGSCGDAPGNRYFDPAILHNGKFEKTKGYCTDVFFDEARKWIAGRVKGEAAASAKPQANDGAAEQGGARGAPFFCYIATNAPHGPLDCPPEYEAKYTKLVNTPEEAKFFGMIANIDDNVGRLLATLTELGVERDTLVIFMNDNGGTAGTKIHNVGMRGQKVTVYRGGTRGASFWRWPGTLKPGDCDRLAAHIDLFPTLAELAGAKVPAEVAVKFDGRSLAPLLRDQAAVWPDRVLFTHVGRWPKGSDANDAKFGNCSIRDPRWNLVSSPRKALVNKPKPGEVLPGREPKWELFDLKADPGETKNVAAEHPDVVARLAKAYDAWWADVVPHTLANEQAVGPKMNPYHELYYAQFGGGPSGVKPAPK